eukprot:CAMPEP_0184482550 /NCGR_PEP_ID=MMETSP0113_2-20130426/4115_1 /TAXON_ID=91329 /ORGANISM="Norrisiella sphaerica, Strain BC52" /LENGTH=380 /DNA_ID=CAMNT_0026862351 /DNA_START=262 /DNA_END=1404 /DNA_ORIENTATION=-
MQGRRCSNKRNGGLFCAIHANQGHMWLIRLIFVVLHYVFIESVLSAVVDSTRRELHHKTQSFVPQWVVALACSTVLTTASGILEWASAIFIRTTRINSRRLLDEAEELAYAERLVEAQNAQSSSMRNLFEDTDPSEAEEDSDEDYIPGTRNGPELAWGSSSRRSLLSRRKSSNLKCSRLQAVPAGALSGGKDGSAGERNRNSNNAYASTEQEINKTHNGEPCNSDTNLDRKFNNNKKRNGINGAGLGGLRPPPPRSPPSSLKKRRRSKKSLDLSYRPPKDEEVDPDEYSDEENDHKLKRRKKRKKKNKRRQEKVLLPPRSIINKPTQGDECQAQSEGQAPIVEKADGEEGKDGERRATNCYLASQRQFIRKASSVRFKLE